MSYDAWVYLETAGLQMPKDPENKVSKLAVFRVLSNFVCHAQEPDLLGWVGSRTQEQECDMARSSVLLARQLLEQHGWLIKTGVVHRAGALEYKVVLPGYEPSSGMSKHATNEPFSGLSSGIPSGLSSGTSSGTSSGLSSGIPSGTSSGVFSNAKTEQNLNEKELNTTEIEIQKLFGKVLSVELKIRPTAVPINVLINKKSAEYLPICEHALNRFPGGADDRDVAAWVLSKIYGERDSKFSISRSTIASLEQKYLRPNGNGTEQGQDIYSVLSRTVSQFARPDLDTPI